MAYQWGRLIYWLSEGQNAAAIQALSAMMVAILTATLIWVTWRYVRLTKTIAEVALRQLAVSIQPALVLAVLEQGVVTRRSQAVRVNGRVGIKNGGANPVKIISISLIVQFRSPQKFSQIPYPIMQLDNVVLMPSEEYVQNFGILTDMTSDETGEYALGLGVDCTDLARVSEHSFYLDPQGQLRHFLGFQKALPWRLRARKRIRQAMQTLKRWAARPN